MQKKKIIIIGAGPGGLSAGMLLAHRGFDVQIFEKEKIPGGRNGSLQLGDFKFDIGPTFFMMDFVLRSIFKQTGRNLDKYVKLIKLDPMYRLYFNDKYIDIYQDRKNMAKELKRVFPGNEKGLAQFYKKEKKRLAKLYPILKTDNDSLFDALSPQFLSALPKFSIGKSLYASMGEYFKDEFARLSFTFQSKYLGMSPWDCPAAFSMVPYVEHTYGIYHIKGGLSESINAMAKVVTEEGGKINYNSAVRQIMTEGDKAVGVVLKNGKKVLADKVIVNADFSYAVSNLFPKRNIKKYTPAKLKKMKYSCSILMIYLGLNKKFVLRHHTVVFAKNYKRNVDNIFSGKLTENDFSLYVRDASKKDPTLAPKGKTALYLLIPVPNNRAKVNWKQKAKDIRDQALDILESRLNMKGIKEAIEKEKIITPDNWSDDFNVHLGAVFNLSHHLDQMLWFRPHNKFEEVKNCYLVGGGTHPGSGLPTIYESGRIAANLISEEFGVKFKG